ncbi:MAG: LysR family substrate-binding domain-containing protein, partial [Hyphomonadaceae bacterium]
DAFDLALIAGPVDDSRIAGFLMGSEMIMACLPADHPLASKEVIEFADLRGQPLVMFPEQMAPNIYRLFLTARHNEGFEPYTAKTEITPEHMMTSVVSGLGIGFVSSVSLNMAPAGVVLRPMSEPVQTMPISLAWREDKETPIVRDFIAAAREVVGEVRAPTKMPSIRPPRS